MGYGKEDESEEKVYQEYGVANLNDIIKPIGEESWYDEEVQHIRLSINRREDCYVLGESKIENYYRYIKYWLSIILYCGEEDGYESSYDTSGLLFVNIIINNSTGAILSETVKEAFYKYDNKESLGNDAEYDLFFDEFEELFDSDIRQYGDQLKTEFNNAINSFEKSWNEYDTLGKGEIINLFDFNKILTRLKEYQVKIIEKNIVVDNEQSELADQLEIVKTFYDDGTLQQEYQINTKQEKDGYHRIYYPNGQLKVESIWTNGLQDDGDVISYHDDGSKARQVTLVDHLMNGNYFEWYKNGQLKTQGIYNDKIPTILKQWDENGTSKKVNTAPKPKLTPPPVKDSFEAKEDLIIQEITEAPVINKEENKEKVKEVETIAEKEIQKKNNSKRLYLIIFCVVGVIGIFFISKSISKIYLGSSQNQSSKNKTLDVPNGNTYLYNRHQEFNITLPGEVYYGYDQNQESLSNENFVAYLSVYTAGNGYEYISDFTNELNEFAEDYGYTEIRKFTKGSISSEISYEFYSGYSPDDRCTVIFGVIQNSFSRKLYDFNLICLKIDLKTATSIINSIEIK